MLARQHNEQTICLRQLIGTDDARTPELIDRGRSVSDAVIESQWRINSERNNRIKLARVKARNAARRVEWERFLSAPERKATERKLTLVESGNE